MPFSPSRRKKEAAIPGTLRCLRQLVPPAALRLRAPPAHTAAGGHRFRKYQPPFSDHPRYAHPRYAHPRYAHPRHSRPLPLSFRAQPALSFRAQRRNLSTEKAFFQLRPPGPIPRPSEFHQRPSPAPSPRSIAPLHRPAPSPLRAALPLRICILTPAGMRCRASAPANA